MLRLLTAAALIYGCSAAITDTNCTATDKYEESAFNCENVIADDLCKVLMKQTTELKAGGSDDREGSCKAATDDERTAILSTCPKTCGYCCLSEAYQCEDKDKPSIDCTTVTMDMCKSDLWKPVLAENCPKTCGLCKDSPGSGSNCKDAAPGCDKDKNICQNINMQDFVKKNCQKTCDLCDESTTASSDASTGASDATTASSSDSSDASSAASDAASTGAADTTVAQTTAADTTVATTEAPTTELATTEAPTTTVPCGDDPKCAKWVKNGFCDSPYYPDDMKKQFCGKSCNMC